MSSILPYYLKSLQFGRVNTKELQKPNFTEALGFCNFNSFTTLKQLFYGDQKILTCP